jgi:hypothetical protein
MNLFSKAFRSRASREVADGDAPTPSPADADLTQRFDRLSERDAVNELGQLDQAGLGAVETFERSHRARPALLNKLRYLRQPEPLPGYDRLEPDAIADALGTADAATIKLVREYERKMQRRPGVLKIVSLALHQVAERPAVKPTPAVDRGQPLVVGNGLPVKTPPEPLADL